MAQDRCSQDEAFAKLQKASANRNEKLRDVAEDILRARTKTGHAAASTHFDE